MANGKTFHWGDHLVNFSRKGIAFKRVGESETHRIRNPFFKEDADEDEYERDRGGYDEEEYDRYEDEEEDDEEEDDRRDAYEDGAIFSRMDALMDSSWLVWVLLIALPPVGVWLLWKQNRHDVATRSVISIAALVWFIILLVLLFGGSRKDTKVISVVSTYAPQATEAMRDGGEETQPDVVVTSVPAAQPTEEPVEAAPTPISGNIATPAPTEIPEEALATVEPTEVPTEENTYVYCTSGGRRYHAYATCSGMQNASKVPVSVAKGMNKKPCEVCLAEDGMTPLRNSEGGSTDNGSTDTDNTDNTDNTGSTGGVLSVPVPAPTAVRKNAAGGTNNNKSGSGPYYATRFGTYYHKVSDCSGMKNATSITAAKAIAMGKKACPTCVGSVYATSNGKYYHKTSNCSGMQNASLVTVAAAKKRGQAACPICMGTSGTVYYATATGKYYHLVANCSGMQNAAQTTVATAKKRGQTACPECIGNKTTTYYYATDIGKYYHTNMYCSNMSGAKQVTKVVAQSRGQTPCPVCIAAAGNATQKTATTYYYSTTAGKYYHKTANCSGMQNASKVSLAVIRQRGQTACPVCLGGKSSIVTQTKKTTYYYATAHGKYYHTKANCSGMQGAVKVSLTAARARGQSPCPKCAGGKTQKSGTTTVKYYYATRNGKYYHKTAGCSGMVGATKVSLTAAKSRGQTACPKCLGGVNDYYSTVGGRYYHKYASCSGMQGASKVSYATALKRGQTACPKCLGGKATGVSTKSSAKKTSVKYYYATKSGKYYHTKATCSGMRNASKVSLTAARRNGQTACPICAGGTATGGSYKSTIDGTTSVWISPNMYYHSRQKCTNAKGGEVYVTTLSYALSNGYARCTVCKAPQ